MKFLIIKPGLVREYTSENWTPLGVGYLAAFLEKHGIDVKIIDNSIMKLTDSQLINILEEYLPDAVGFSVYTFEAPIAYKMAKMFKDIFPNMKIIFGGVHPTFMPEESLSNFGDYIVIGEGEITTLELLHAIEEKEEPINVLGIIYKRDGEVIRNPPRSFIKNLDELPFPARHLLPMDRYTDKLRNGTPAISIITGRGCPYECVFCCSPKIYGRKVRYRSIKNIISEIKECLDKFNVHAIQIMDDSLSLSKERINSFCQELIKERINIEWACLTRVDIIDNKLLSIMKKAGCVHIAYGIESGNEHQLRLIKKHITLDHARNAVKLTKNIGIQVEGLFMVGNIGETRETLHETLKFAKELDLDFYSFQLATPFPGSEFWDIGKNYGKILSKGYEHFLSDEVTFVPNGLSEDVLLEMFHTSSWSAYTANPLKSLILHRHKILYWIKKDPLFLMKMLIKLHKS